MLLARLRCSMTGHAPLLRDREGDQPVWRCPRCWNAHGRERVEDPRPVRPLDPRFVFDPAESESRRQQSIRALRAARLWRNRAMSLAALHPERVA